MNSTFAQILGKLIKNKMSGNLKNLKNLKEKKVKIQPCAQLTDLPKTG
jgi:peroxiredoxin family protein